MSPEEDRTRNAVDSEPKHYQLSYSGPLIAVCHDSMIIIQYLDNKGRNKCINYNGNDNCGDNNRNKILPIFIIIMMTIDDDDYDDVIMVNQNWKCKKKKKKKKKKRVRGGEE